MGGATAEESLRCACYREPQEFQKVVELEDTGLVVYCRTTRREDVQPGELIGTTTSATQDAFILHNTKAVKITPSDLKNALEKNDISCPRCRQIFEHAQELLHKVKFIDRKNVMGVCDHCLKKAKSIKKPCEECEEIEKKFISTRDKQKEDTKRCIKLWLTKMSGFLKGAITPDKKVKTRAYSDLQIDQLYQYSPKSRREPEVKQMFYRETRKSDTNLYTETDINLTGILEKSVGFTQTMGSADTPSATYGGGSINTITAAPWLVESDVKLGEPHKVAKESQKASLKDRQDHREIQEQFYKYYDDSSMDVKDSIKKKHDLSLRHMIKTEEKTKTPFRPEIYEIPKIAPWELETISKHSDDSEIDVNLATKTKHDESSKETVNPKDQNLYSTSQIPLKYKSLEKNVLKQETLKQKIGPEIELKSLQSVPSKPIKYVTSKTSQKKLREKSHKKKDHMRSSDNIDESVMDVKGATKRKFDLTLKHMMGFERVAQDSSEQHIGKKGLYDSEEKLKKTKKRDVSHLTDDELKYHRSLAKFSHEGEKPGQRMAKTKIKGEKPIDSEKIPEYVLRKQFSYFFPKTLEKKEKVLGARSSQLIKNTQERLRQRAEEEKKRHEEELKYQLQEEEKKRLAREEKKRLAEEQKKQQIFMEDKKKLPEVTKYIEKELQSKMISEDGKIQYIPKDKDKLDSKPEYETKALRKPELKEKDDQVIRKGTKDETVRKSKTEPIDKMDEVSENIKKSIKLKSEQRDEIDAISEGTKKERRSKLEQRDKLDEVLEKPKKELKSKSEQRDKIDDVLEKTKKELKAKPEQRDKIDDVLEKPKKELKSKPEQRDKIDDILEKPKKELKSSVLEQRDKVGDASEKLKKDLMAKHEQRDKIDGVSEKTKRDKSKSETRDVSEDLSEKTKKDFKSKSDHKDKFDAVLEKSKKDLNLKPEQDVKTHEVSVKTKQELKSKSEQKDEIHEVSEKYKKDKSKSEPKEKKEDVIEKLKKAQRKDDEVPEKAKKDLKLKSDIKEQSGDPTERSKRDSRSKSEPRDKIDEISEKAKKESKSKSEKSDTTNEVTEKSKKDLKSKAEPTDKIDKENEKNYKTKIKSIEKEAETSQKEMSKEERKEQLKRDQEDKERLAQVAQLRKERESHKKQDSTKETEEGLKKKIESSKDKKVSSKKTEESSKANVEPFKKSDLAKMQRESSADTEAPLATKEWTAKELKEFAKKQQELEKEQISERKQGLSKDVTEPSKKKTDSINEKEGASKGKEKIIQKKEEPPKVKEESKTAVSKVADASKKPKDGMDEAQFRKLQAELAKQKEADLKNKRMLDAEAQKLRDLADKRAKEEADQKSKLTREAKAVMKPEPARPSPYSIKEVKESTMKELKIHNIKIRNRSSDDLILRLVRIKQTATRQTIKPRPCDIDPEVLKAHRCHYKSGQTSSLCELCNDSELEIDVESYDNKLNLKKQVSEIIIGEKIFKRKPLHREKTEEREVVPILFQSIFQEEPLPTQEIVQIVPQETEPLQKPVLATLLQSKDSKGMDPEPGRGIIRYALSDRTFIDKGWTMLPTEKVVRKMNVYRMRPAHPEFDWFEHNKNKRLMNYDSGEKLAEFDDNGRGRWYYRSGRLALDYYDAEETNAQQRFVIYSSGEPDERGRTHPITILATFDYLGNGIVFDHAGKIRLKYNQTEGVVLDRGIGPVSHWKWHTLNDPPVLQQVMIDTQMAHKDPAIIKLGTPADTKTRPDNEEMLAIEFDNFIKEKSKKLSQKFKPFQIKMKALKINEHFSLKVLDQATIYLIFRDGSTNLKLNIGMILDHQEIVDTDTAEVGEVSNNLERFPARTDSLAGLQRSVAYAQRYERQRTERERRLRPPEPCASADQLTAAASPPLRLPLRTMPAGSTSSAGYCNCRKPTNNLYYNTRLL